MCYFLSVRGVTCWVVGLSNPHPMGGLNFHERSGEKSIAKQNLLDFEILGCFEDNPVWRASRIEIPPSKEVVSHILGGSPKIVLIALGREGLRIRVGCRGRLRFGCGTFAKHVWPWLSERLRAIRATPFSNAADSHIWMVLILDVTPKPDLRLILHLLRVFGGNLLRS